MIEMTVAFSMAWWWRLYWRFALWTARGWMAIGFPLDANAFAKHLERMTRRAVRLTF